MEEITSMLDARLPQPAEWDDLPQPGLSGLLRALARRRSRVDDATVEAIDQEMLRLLRPYLKDQVSVCSCGYRLGHAEPCQQMFF